MKKSKPNKRSIIVPSRTIVRPNNPRYRLLPAALAALAIAVWMPSVLAYECDCGIEVASGDVTINGHVITNCINVASGAKIYINGKLTLTGSGCAVSTVDGKIYLTTYGSVLEFTDNNHTLTGNGQIIGQCNTAKISLVGSITLTSEIKINGSMQIRAGSGTFDNDGLVEANRANENDNRLTLYSGTFSGGIGDYTVNTASAYLQFRAGVTATGMSADFIVGAGTLDINENVCTTGDLDFQKTGSTSPEIEVAPGTSFKAGGTCP